MQQKQDAQQRVVVCPRKVLLPRGMGMADLLLFKVVVVDKRVCMYACACVLVLPCVRV